MASIPQSPEEGLLGRTGSEHAKELRVVAELPESGPGIARDNDTQAAGNDVPSNAVIAEKGPSKVTTRVLDDTTTSDNNRLSTGETPPDETPQLQTVFGPESSLPGASADPEAAAPRPTDDAVVDKARDTQSTTTPSSDQSRSRLFDPKDPPLGFALPVTAIKDPPLPSTEAPTQSDAQRNQTQREAATAAGSIFEPANADEITGDDIQALLAGKRALLERPKPKPTYITRIELKDKPKVEKTAEDDEWDAILSKIDKTPDATPKGFLAHQLDCLVSNINYTLETRINRTTVERFYERVSPKDAAQILDYVVSDANIVHSI